jgi:methylthioribose-1-phosphate isomerase
MEQPLLLDLKNNLYLEGDTLVIIDRRKLPQEIAKVRCSDFEEVARAIEDMVIQGAGDIAVTAGFGLYLAALKLPETDAAKDISELERAAARLRETRPTGFHLAILMEKILGRVRQEISHISARETIMNYLNTILKRHRTLSQDTGKHAETLLTNGDTILTHCFPGPALLYMLQYAKENNKEIKVICTETRPYLQGARLTAWSVSQLGIDTTLITDNMAAYCMSRGMIQKVFAAADRIAMDGTIANKVGTFQLAISAGYHKIPFYIMAYGNPDHRTLYGKDIPIEERDPREVLEFRGAPISGPHVKAYYPAFDLTPSELVTGIVTAKSVYLFDNKKSTDLISAFFKESIE